jgi:hypothetical protein
MLTDEPDCPYVANSVEEPSEEIATFVFVVALEMEVSAGAKQV